MIRTSTIVPPAVITVEIDIKPGSEPNSINPRSKGNIPVAILTTAVVEGDPADFDAWDVNSQSVRFGPGRAGIVHSQGHADDVDLDGDLDMVVHFNAAEVGITCGDVKASLVGETFGVEPVEGTDSIITVGCR